MKSRSASLAVVIMLALMLAGCSAATPSPPPTGSVVPSSSALITNEPLSPNTQEDVLAAEAVLAAHLEAQGLHGAKMSRPGYSTSDDIPAGWFEKHTNKPFKAITLIGDAGQGGSREYQLVRESESATWTLAFD